MARIIYILIFVLVIVCSSMEYSHWNPNRRPKVMGDIISLKSLSPRRSKIQKKIILYHNVFRSAIKPSAANMLRMKWHREAAKAAQRWADACFFLIHDNVTGRHIDDYGACGQNIFIASHKVPWFFAIESWWLEKDDFSYGKRNNLTVIGHYTQMVWASTHEIGCGIAKCYHHGNYTNSNRTKLYYNYVCNYCPIGNQPGRLGFPYRKGKSCALCKKHCKGKLCLNACHSSDQWSNCKKLYKAHPHWLCRSETEKGRERFASCQATCTCKHKIYD